MPAKKDPDILEVRDLEVFKKHVMENKSLSQTAHEMGVSRDTVKRTKKKPAYRQLILDAMEEHGFGVKDYVAKLVKLTDAKKTINVGGVEVEVDDNPVQLGAIKKVGDIYGDDAPKEFGLTHSASGSSDDELFEELEDALQSRPDMGVGEQGLGTGDAGEG